MTSIVGTGLMAASMDRFAAAADGSPMLAQTTALTTVFVHAHSDFEHSGVNVGPTDLEGLAYLAEVALRLLRACSVLLPYVLFHDAAYRFCFG